MAERQVKCKNCGNKMPKSKAYQFEYLDGNLNIKNKYYCNESCCEEKESENTYISESYDLLNDILEMPVRTNIYFNKMYKEIKEHYRIKVIHAYLKEEREMLNLNLQKDFISPNVKIKYFFAIIQDNIPKFNSRFKTDEIKKDIKELEVFEELKDEDLNSSQINNKKRSLQDILNEL